MGPPGFQDQAKLQKPNESWLDKIERLLTQLVEKIRTIGSLPSNTEKNPREEFNAITLRNGRSVVDAFEKDDSEKANQEPRTAKSGDKHGVPIPQSNSSDYVPPPVPFSQRLQKKRLDTQFSKFLDIFKRLHINIPFAKVLEHMPNYAKFMKELLSKKRKFMEHEVVMINEECSAIIHQKLPQKLKDSGSFTIPCAIGGELKSTTISLQLADRSVIYPLGLLEVVLVKMDKFIFLVDFVVLDMEGR
ncbi:hypothetical protein LIER_38373 [Lithospermum erythrorhizon]|uniref:Retrotransposon gag protein n=1 Tax=Lithospermum erythrorhizon TaxID=34254 RepID=A0AAV3Q0P6_LITER